MCFLRGEFAPGQAVRSLTHTLLLLQRALLFLLFKRFTGVHRMSQGKRRSFSRKLLQRYWSVGQVRDNHRPCSRGVRTDRFRICTTSCATAKQLLHPPSTCCTIVFDMMLFHSCPYCCLAADNQHLKRHTEPGKPRSPHTCRIVRRGRLRYTTASPGQGRVSATPRIPGTDGCQTGRTIGDPRRASARGGERGRPHRQRYFVRQGYC